MAMNKNIFGEAAAGLAGQSPFPMMGREQMQTMLDANRKLMQQVEEINRGWAASVKQTMDSGSELTSRLISCTNPAEAASLYSDWLRERTETFVSDSRRLGEMWMGLCASCAPGAKANGEATATSGHEPGLPKKQSAAAE
jgi:hypothetical protein